MVGRLSVNVLGVTSAPRIEIEDSGTINDLDSAYPQAVVLASGDILCSFSNAGGSAATGGTDWAHSHDHGRTWRHGGTILPAGAPPGTTNFLKLSRAPDERTVYAYGARLSRAALLRFGERTAEAIYCASEDDGVHWSAPSKVPMPTAHLEISHGMLALARGYRIAPAATTEPSRLGERVIGAVSSDWGATWHHVEIFHDRAGMKGYLEHKLTDLGRGRLLATAWTVKMADVSDLPNSYALSRDKGRTWSEPKTTDLNGQTMSGIPLGGDWLLVVYNRRTGQPGIVVATVSIQHDRWRTHREVVLYSPGSTPPQDIAGDHVAAMQRFEFGFPTAIHLADKAVLVTFWSKEGGRYGTRWARLRIGWTPG